MFVSNKLSLLSVWIQTEENVTLSYIIQTAHMEKY